MNYYQRYLRKLMRGRLISPRTMATRAVFNETFTCLAGDCWRRPHDNPAIGIIEGLQFIAGLDDKEAIQAVAKSVDLDLFGPTSFYGPRTVGQFERVITELLAHPDSRRGTVLIANNDDTSETMPCTISMQFFVVDGSLNLTVMLRSSDAVWGLPYDTIQYGLVLMAMSNCLFLRPGSMTLNIVNAHVYLDHDGGKEWTQAKYSLPIVHRDWSQYKLWATEIVARKYDKKVLMEMFLD